MRTIENFLFVGATGMTCFGGIRVMAIFFFFKTWAVEEST